MFALYAVLYVFMLDEMPISVLCLQLNADLKSVDEDKDRTFAKLNDEIKAKEDLEGEICKRFAGVAKPRDFIYVTISTSACLLRCVFVSP